MKTKTEKIIPGFDCIAFKRVAAEKLHQRTKHMSDQEKLAYWNRQTNLLKAKQAKLKSSLS